MSRINHVFSEKNNMQSSVSFEILSERSKQIYVIITRPIPARSCGAGVKDCRVKELDLI